jgi:hypothetical protein
VCVCVHERRELKRETEREYTREEFNKRHKESTTQSANHERERESNELLRTVAHTSKTLHVINYSRFFFLTDTPVTDTPVRVLLSY